MFLHLFVRDQRDLDLENGFVSEIIYYLHLYTLSTVISSWIDSPSSCSGVQPRTPSTRPETKKAPASWSPSPEPLSHPLPTEPWAR